jgi:hypothetical protein
MKNVDHGSFVLGAIFSVVLTLIISLVYILLGYM